MTQQPIIIDTDIGDDIDDALALTVALHSPELEVRGITTVFRDAPRRTVLTRQLLELLGRPDVPIAAGHSRPVVQPWSNIQHPGNEGAKLGRQFEALDPTLQPEPGQHAVEFLREQILKAHAQGERLTVVGIAPMMNLAMLFYQYPELASLCRVLLMAGHFVPEPWAEWNVYCDPEAAAMTMRVLTEIPGADISFVGLDVTMRCVLNDEQLQLFSASKHPYAQFLGELINLWAHPIMLHDPLTILTLFDDCVTFAPARVEVALCGEERGKTLLVKGEPNCRIATEVDVERAIALFLQRALR